MNSMPAASSARRTDRSLAAVMEVFFSASSARRIVATPTADSRARSSARHRTRDRAALICALVNGLNFVLTTEISHDMQDIIRYLTDRGIVAAANAILQSGERDEIKHGPKGLWRSTPFHRWLGRPHHHGR